MTSRWSEVSLVLLLLLQGVATVASECIFHESSAHPGMERFTRQEVDGSLTLKCLTGAILVEGDDVSLFDVLSCVDDEWFGTTCSSGAAKSYANDIRVYCNATATIKQCEAGELYVIPKKEKAILEESEDMIILKCPTGGIRVWRDESVVHGAVTCFGGEWFGTNCDGTAKAYGYDVSVYCDVDLPVCATGAGVIVNADGTAACPAGQSLFYPVKIEATPTAPAMDIIVPLGNFNVTCGPAVPPLTGLAWRTVNGDGESTYYQSVECHACEFVALDVTRLPTSEIPSAEMPTTVPSTCSYECGGKFMFPESSTKWIAGNVVSGLVDGEWQMFSYASRGDGGGRTWAPVHESLLYCAFASSCALDPTAGNAQLILSSNEAAYCPETTTIYGSMNLAGEAAALWWMPVEDSRVECVAGEWHTDTGLSKSFHKVECRTCTIPVPQSVPGEEVPSIYNCMHICQDGKTLFAEGHSDPISDNKIYWMNSASMEPDEYRFVKISTVEKEDGTTT
ncbi:hypothetical protein PFISCL1PPCAC_13396, partial [Pristionchus fissidentatus]